MRSMVGHSSSLMRVKPPMPCACATWKIFASASSSSSAAEIFASNASPTMRVETSMRRRSSAFSRTIFAWYSTFAAVGTASRRSAR
jgi:hypothetical protein